MAGEAWQQQVDALVSELQAAMTQDALSAFFQGERQHHHQLCAHCARGSVGAR